MAYRYGSHTVSWVQYHFVFITKYCYKLPKCGIRLKFRKLIRQTCQAFKLEILKSVVSQAYMQGFVSGH